MMYGMIDWQQKIWNDELERFVNRDDLWGERGMDSFKKRNKKSNQGDAKRENRADWMNAVTWKAFVNLGT